MWSVLSMKLRYWPAKSSDQREGSGKFIKRENQECSRNWTVLAQHEPNQTYMEDNWELSMKVFIIWASLIYPLPHGFTFLSCLGTIALQRWCCLCGPLPETGSVMVPAHSFIPPGCKLVCRVASLYSCVHMYTHCTVCIAQLSPSWIEQYC